MKKLLMIFLLMVAGLASAEENQWHWAMAQNCTNRWNLWKGLADVKIDGDKFVAKLYWENDKKSLAILLKGTIKGGKLKVVETEMNTDVEEATFTGTYTKSKGDEGWSESINLSDGLSMIGLTRGEIGKNPAPKLPSIG